MKKLGLFITIVALLSTLVSSSIAYATETGMDNVSLSATATQTTMPKIVYSLPYPGILPDNPLYKLKQLRNKIVLYLINDPLKRINFYLLEADKQMAMILPLIEKKNVELAQQTALKAENNFTEITYVYKNNHIKPTPQMLTKLKNASLKHQEVLQKIKNKVDDSQKQDFEQVINFSKTNLKEIERIFQEKKVN